MIIFSYNVLTNLIQKKKYKWLLTPHVQTTWLGVLGALSARGGGELVLKGGNGVGRRARGDRSVSG